MHSPRYQCAIGRCRGDNRRGVGPTCKNTPTLPIVVTRASSDFNFVSYIATFGGARMHRTVLSATSRSATGRWPAGGESCISAAASTMARNKMSFMAGSRDVFSMLVLLLTIGEAFRLPTQLPDVGVAKTGRFTCPTARRFSSSRLHSASRFPLSASSEGYVPRPKPILDGVEFPADLKKLSMPQLKQICEELRWEVIESVSKTGGHLSSSLGVTELTVALHYVFDAPEDKIVWDVAHQCYPHKMLTGRRSRFNTLRQWKGISGFTKRAESE